MKIIITEKFYLNNDLLNPGDTKEVSDALAKDLIQQSRAKLSAEEKPIKTDSKVIE